MDIIISLAYLAIVLQGLSLLIAPSFIGSPQGDYSYFHFLGEVATALIVIPLALRVLGVI